MRSTIFGPVSREAHTDQPPSAMYQTIFRRSIVLLLALAVGACGPPPQPVSQGAGASNAGGAQAGPLDPSSMGEMPPGHPATGAASGPAGGMEDEAAQADHHWDGNVRLRGGLAQLGEGFLFVSVKPDGVRMPSYSVKLELSTGQPDGDDLVVPFEITEANLMGGLVPGMGEIVIEAYYDPDGYVDSKEGQVRNSVPVEVDQSGVEIVLEN